MQEFGITDTLFSRAGSKRWSTYLKYRGHVHTTGLLPTVVLLQHSVIELLTALAHTPVRVSTVEVTVPQPQRGCS